MSYISPTIGVGEFRGDRLENDAHDLVRYLSILLILFIIYNIEFYLTNDRNSPLNCPLLLSKIPPSTTNTIYAFLSQLWQEQDNRAESQFSATYY
jgi:hypothetical protein